MFAIICYQMSEMLFFQFCAMTVVNRANRPFEANLIIVHLHICTEPQKVHCKKLQKMYFEHLQKCKVWRQW